MVLNFISLLIDQMRGTSHESQTAWVGCLDRRTNQSCPHRRIHQSCYNRHGEHINLATITMENTSIQASQENTSILLQSPQRTHQSRAHRRTHQSCYNRHGEHINPALIGELIILLHRRANHPVPQESESSCPTREQIILFQCAPPGEGESPCDRMLLQ